MNKILLPILLIISGIISYAQTPEVTNAQTRNTAFETRKSLQQNSLLANIPLRNAGPTVMSGRVTDFAVNPNNPNHFYVAYASGGLWLTKNNGQSFVPLFDNQAVMTIGAIAVDWTNGETIWVGTGEVNSSRSSYAGNGVYKSTDKGKTWQYFGLPESQHIGRIVLHPTNGNTAWVAALGHLYSPNTARGVYKTTNGGKTWKHTLAVNQNTGAVELTADPKDPNTLYAAMWTRTRRAWNFTEAGKGSGIYKSTDGGENWQLISGAKSGFPYGEGVGRIGLTVSHQNSQVVYAFLDNQFHRKASSDKQKKAGLTKDDFRKMKKAKFLKLKDDDIKTFLRKNRFPREYSVKKVRAMVANEEITPAALTEYLEDANALLFSSPVIGAQVYRSDDGGATWKQTHSEPLDGVVYTYGYYFGVIKVAPYNDNELYILGVPILKSSDAGKNWDYIGGESVHSDHQALWVNPNLEGHIIDGNDGGVNISYDHGKNWTKCNSPAVGQFYSISYDMDEPYNLYGGLQDNGVWVGSSEYRTGTNWHGSGEYPYKSIMGGDGMQVQVDFRDNNTVYTGYQFGNYYRINKATGDQTYIQPKHKLGERPLRFNWQTPIHLSRHNQDILYMGSNKLHRSMHKGDNMQAISGDLTQGGKKGDVAFGTLTAIDESPLQFGMLYVGSDDGLIHHSPDGGYTWNKVSDPLPPNFWVSHVVASAHKKSRVYASLNGYRNDNFEPYVYVSDDFGKTWKSIVSGLPKEPVNVVCEDPKNENIVYVGTDNGLYVSLNGGKDYMAMHHGLPAVAVHDLEVHPTANELIVGTHGRSIYLADVSVIQQLTPELMKQKLAVFKTTTLRHSEYWGRSWSKWYASNPPKKEIGFYAQKAGEATVWIRTKSGVTVNEIIMQVTAGVNFAAYDISVADDNVFEYNKYLSKVGELAVEKADNGKTYIAKGSFKILVSLNGETKEIELKVN